MLISSPVKASIIFSSLFSTKDCMPEINSSKFSNLSLSSASAKSASDVLRPERLMISCPKVKASSFSTLKEKD